MKLIGFNFKKIKAEKKSEIKEQPKINTSINIKEIKEIKTELFNSKENLLIIEFNYKIDYSKELAELEFEGNFILSLDSKEAEKILKDWKSKKLEERFQMTIFNIILRKVNVKAASLEEELNLPLHFQMPSLKANKKEN